MKTRYCDLSALCVFVVSESLMKGSTTDQLNNVKDSLYSRILFEKFALGNTGYLLNSYLLGKTLI